MKSKGFLFIIILAMLMQSFLSFNMLADRYDGKFPTALIFLLGIEPKTEYTPFILWYFVFVSISFYFTGDIAESLSGYGKYMLIRQYNKVKWIIRRFLTIAIKLFGFSILQSILSFFTVSIWLQKQVEFSHFNMLLKALSIYYLTLLSLLLLQMLLELYIEPQIALVSVNIYVVFSIALAGILFVYNKGQLLLYCLLPNYAMGLRTSIAPENSMFISYPVAVTVLFIILAIIVVISAKKIQVKDLY